MNNRLVTLIIIFLTLSVARGQEFKVKDFGKAGENLAVAGYPVDAISAAATPYSVVGSAINGHEYVDLGLPSGVKWATCNVGAKSPEDYGSYFAWGEIKTKREYTKSNCGTSNKNFQDINGRAEYDPARANWGGNWRMPTKAEFEELLKKCKWKWTEMGGHKGYKVTGPNGNSIFLPAAGSMFDSSLDDAGASGVYWSSTPYSGTGGAYALYFHKSTHKLDWGYREFGQSIRPVVK